MFKFSVQQNPGLDPHATSGRRAVLRWSAYIFNMQVENKNSLTFRLPNCVFRSWNGSWENVEIKILNARSLANAGRVGRIL